MLNRTKRRGATLIEAVAAITVLGLALPPLSGMFAEVSAHTVDDTYQRMAVAYADAMMEEVVARAFEDPDLVEGSFGAEEASRAFFDDIDDYDGYSESPLLELDGDVLDEYPVFQRGVFVDNTTATAPDPAIPEPDGSTAFKRIRVVVRWSASRGGEFTLTTLRTRLGQSVPTGPLDVTASEATAVAVSNVRTTIELVNSSGADLVMESFELSADVPTSNVWFAGLDNWLIWLDWFSEPLPTGVQPLNWGSTAVRTVPAGSSSPLLFQFTPAPSGSVTYTLVVRFTNGESSTLQYTIDW